MYIYFIVTYWLCQASPHYAINFYLYDLSYPCNIQCLLPSKHVDSPLRNPAFRISLNYIDYLVKKNISPLKKKWENVALCFKVISPCWSSSGDSAVFSRKLSPDVNVHYITRQSKL